MCDFPQIFTEKNDRCTLFSVEIFLQQLEISISLIIVTITYRNTQYVEYEQYSIGVTNVFSTLLCFNIQD